MIKPREFQSESVEGLWRYLRNCKGNPVLELPTGSGKSVIIAMICDQLSAWGYRAVILQRNKELVQQNMTRLHQLSPSLSVGAYSASLKSRNTDSDFIFATIQSVADKAHEFGQRNMIIVDECHQVPRGDESQYGRFLKDMNQYNKNTVMVGLTATGYRLDCGPIIGEGQPFDGLAHSVSIKRLLDEGYITPLKSVGVSSQIDRSKLTKATWDFRADEMQAAFSDKVVSNVTELLNASLAHRRNHCLLFSSGVEHAHSIRDALLAAGENAEVVTGDTLPIERSRIIGDFVAGRLKWLVNCDVLTTGFDAPNVDMIGVMRSTDSPGLFYQICGRGMRLSEGKTDCIIMDFGGNIEAHGAIDSEEYGVKSIKKDGEAGVGPKKQCPSCGQFVPAGSRECGCGFRFPKPQIAVSSTSDDSRAVMESVEKTEPLKVAEVMYGRHKKEGGQDSLVVTYELEKGENDLFAPSYRSWWCIEHSGYARVKFEKEWRKVSKTPFPSTIDEALILLDSGAACKPKEISVALEGKYWRVDVPFQDDRPDPVHLPELGYDEEDLPF